jgi:hypothetical protein
MELSLPHTFELRNSHGRTRRKYGPGPGCPVISLDTFKIM